jgi:hypothetical protein
VSVHNVVVRIVVEDEMIINTDWYDEGDTIEEMMDAEAAAIELDPWAVMESPTASWSITVEQDC